MPYEMIYDNEYLPHDMIYRPPQSALSARLSSRHTLKNVDLQAHFRYIIIE